MKNKFLCGALSLLVLLSLVLFTGCPDPGTENIDPVTYSITLDYYIVNGGITLSHTIAAKDTLVTLSATPSVGYKTKNVSVKDATGSTVATIGSGNSLSFRMPASDVTVGGEFEASAYADILHKTVFAGETPDGDWLTISFRTGGVVVWTYSKDNFWSKGAYTYNDLGQGTTTYTEIPFRISNFSQLTGFNLAPNGFTITGAVDGESATLTIPKFKGGADKSFKMVKNNANTILPVPFTLGPLADDLVGSVWAGRTPAGDLSWMTIAIRAKGANEVLIEGASTELITYTINDKVSVNSLAHDNTTAVWTYTQGTNASSKPTVTWSNGLRVQGSSATSLGITTSWNPGPGTILSDDGGPYMDLQAHSGMKFYRYR